LSRFARVKNMHYSSKFEFSRLVILVMLIALSSCATEGIYGFRETGDTSDNGKQSASPVVVPITDELIRLQRETRETQTGQNLQVLISQKKPYVIGPGDVLSIVVWGHPELVASASMTELSAIESPQVGSGTEQRPLGFVVDHDGLLQYPYAGILNLNGLTEVEARDLLSKKIAYYINKPVVTLRVQSFRSKRVYISGEVKIPGLLAINDIPMTLVEALNRAGGVLPTGDLSQISVNRGGTIYHINFQKLVQDGIDPGSLLLIHGDVVRVLSRDESKVFVTGEVNAPKALSMHDGRLTLNEALGEAGGVNTLSGDTRQIYVVRKAVSRQLSVFKLDAGSPGALAIAESFELNPKDMIYVAPNALTDWHRTISLIFPGELSAAIGAGKQP
jgi:polysaccharide export outer membrane protein